MGDVLTRMGKLPICNSSMIVADRGQGLVTIGFCSVFLLTLTETLTLITLIFQLI